MRPPANPHTQLHDTVEIIQQLLAELKQIACFEREPPLLQQTIKFCNQPFVYEQVPSRYTAPPQSVPGPNSLPRYLHPSVQQEQPQRIVGVVQKAPLPEHLQYIITQAQFAGVVVIELVLTPQPHHQEQVREHDIGLNVVIK